MKLSTIKNLALIAFIIGFTLLITTRASQKANMEQLNKRLSSLHKQNIELAALNAYSDSISLCRDAVIQRLKDSINISKQREKQLALANKILNKQLASLPKYIKKIPTDSSYRFLTQTAYPYPGEPKFPLNEPQVKAAHETFMAHELLQDINLNLNNNISELHSQISIHDSIASATEDQLNMCLYSNRNNQQIINNLEETNKLIEADANKNQNRKQFWKRLAQIESVAILIKVIISII